MTDNMPDFDTLSAYIDGELPPRELALVARLADSDAHVALQIRQLSSIKAAVTGFAEPAGLLVVARRKSASRRLVPWRWLTAACVAATVLMTGFFWPGHLPGRSAVSDDRTLTDALAVYDAWSSRPDAPGKVRRVSAFTAPPLDSAGLFLQVEEPFVTIGGLHARHAGYVGVHGCRLSLFSWQERGDKSALELNLTKDADVAGWQAIGRRYLLVSRKMNDSRFAMIAGALRQITRSKGEADTETVELLGSAHQPCVSTG